MKLHDLMFGAILLFSSPSPSPLDNAENKCGSVAANAAKSRNLFYFVPLTARKGVARHVYFYTGAIFLATCFDCGDKLPGVTAAQLSDVCGHERQSFFIYKLTDILLASTR